MGAVKRLPPKARRIESPADYEIRFNHNQQGQGGDNGERKQHEECRDGLADYESEVRNQTAWVCGSLVDGFRHLAADGKDRGWD